MPLGLPWVQNSPAGGGWRAAREIWETFRFEPEEFIDSGDEVVVIGQGRGRIRGTGIEVEQPLAMLWRLRAGRTLFGQTFAEPALAMRAAGLEAG